MYVAGFTIRSRDGFRPSPGARLSLFYWCLFLVIGIHAPFWPVWLQGRGMTAAEIGVLLAAGIWVKVFANPLIGHVVDRRGDRRRPMIVLAGAGLASASRPPRVRLAVRGRDRLLDAAAGLGTVRSGALVAVPALRQSGGARRRRTEPAIRTPAPVGVHQFHPGRGPRRPGSRRPFRGMDPGPGANGDGRRVAVDVLPSRSAPPPHAHPVSRGHGARGGCFHHATAPRPFFATRVKSFSEAPRGRFSPRSHWLTRPVVTLRYRAKTA